MNAMDAMRETARELVAPGKGILAADESSGTIKKQVDQIGVDFHGAEPPALGNCCSPHRGSRSTSRVILFDETIRQATDDGTRLTEVLEKAGVIRASRWTRAPSRSPCSRGRR